MTREEKCTYDNVQIKKTCSAVCGKAKTDTENGATVFDGIGNKSYIFSFCHLATTNRVTTGH